ncbi:unnamed protein product, partial [Allacma fusca]
AVTTHWIPWPGGTTMMDVSFLEMTLRVFSAPVTLDSLRPQTAPRPG